MTTSLTEADRKYIATAPVQDLREELTVAATSGDREYASALAHEILRRRDAKGLTTETKGEI